MSLKNRKAIYTILIMIFAFLILIIGATYAYFSAVISNAGSITKFNITTQSTAISSISAKSDLKLKLTANQMMKQSHDITYYASKTGESVLEDPKIAIGAAKVKGDGKMICNYKFNVISEGDMYDKFIDMEDKSNGQIILNIGGIDYDLNLNLPTEISGVLGDEQSPLIDDGTEKEILASFKVVNKTDKNQTDLAGTHLTLSFTVADFNCEIVG